MASSIRCCWDVLSNARLTDVKALIQMGGPSLRANTLDGTCFPVPKIVLSGPNNTLFSAYFTSLPSEGGAQIEATITNDRLLTVETREKSTGKNAEVLPV